MTRSTRLFLHKLRERNYRLALTNGWLASIGDACMSPGIVLSTFAAQLGASNTVVGLFPALMGGGWLLPQLLVAGLVRSRPYKLPFYRASATVRTATYGWLVLSSFALIAHPDWLLASFIVGLAVNALASGVAGLPVLEVISKTVPAPERPAFFGTRALYGGVLAFGTGYLIQRILGSGIPFPYDYTLIFALGAVAFTLAYRAFGLIEEPPDEPRPREGFREGARAVWRILRGDGRLRNFLLARGLLALAAVADPFYAVYALRELGVPKSTVGLFLMTLAAVAPFSNILWSRLAARKGSRRIVRIATFVQVCTPVLALLMPPGVGAGFALVFVSMSLAGPGLNLGYTSYMLALAPTLERSRYLGLMNTFIGLLSFAPFLGGLLADALGYRAVFVLAIVLLLLSWLAAGRLERDG